MRQVDPIREYERFRAVDLEPGDEFVDLDERGQVLAELRQTVASTDECGLDSPD